MTTENPSPEGAQDEALRLAHALDGGKLIDDSTEWADTLHASATELRRLHARVQELERAVPQWQPIETAPKDRPILLRSKKGRIADGMWIAAADTTGGWAWALVRQEPTHWMPIPPEQDRAVPQWVPVAERLPEPGTPVLLDIGKRFPIRAMWAAKHTVEAPPEQVDIDWGDYDETTDTYYSPEGWYEWNAHEECHWFVHDAPRAWMALPEQVRAHGAQGESDG